MTYMYSGHTDTADARQQTQQKHLTDAFKHSSLYRFSLFGSHKHNANIAQQKL